MEQKDFYKQLERILQMLDTRYNHYTDAYDEETADISDDIEVYDKLDLLIKNTEASDQVKEGLRRVQRKVREAFLLAEDLNNKLRMYD